MNCIPATSIRPARLDQVSGPAIVLPEPGREDAFLVTAGDQPYVCFIQGRSVGDGFMKGRAVRWSGMAIEGVSFEVDPASAFKPAFIDQPLGALVRSGTELLVFVGDKEHHGISEAIRATLLTDLPNSSPNAEVGFTKWRAVLGEGANRISVFDYEATRTANV